MFKEKLLKNLYFVILLMNIYFWLLTTVTMVAYTSCTTTCSLSCVLHRFIFCLFGVFAGHMTGTFRLTPIWQKLRSAIISLLCIPAGSGMVNEHGGGLWSTKFVYSDIFNKIHYICCISKLCYNNICKCDKDNLVIAAE